MNKYKRSLLRLEKVLSAILALLIGLCNIPGVKASENDSIIQDAVFSDEYVNDVLSRRMINAAYYSTNDEETVTRGNTGVYSYVLKQGGNDIYLLIDFDRECVYRITEGKETVPCERIAISNGDLINGLTITYYDQEDEWTNYLCWQFSWAPNPAEVLRLEDNLEKQYYYEITDLEDTLRRMQGKVILDYCNSGLGSTEAVEELYTLDGIRFNQAYVRTVKTTEGSFATYVLFDTKTNSVYELDVTHSHRKTTYKLHKGSYTDENNIRKCRFDDGTTSSYEEYGTSIKWPNTDVTGDQWDYVYKKTDVISAVDRIRDYYNEK